MKIKLHTKEQFEFLLHEVLRDVGILRNAKSNNPDWIDDYVMQQIDEINLFLLKIKGDNL